MPGCKTCGAAHNCPLEMQVSSVTESKARGLDGILNVNKAAGMSSHDVVSVVRRFSHLTRVGHAGTLDPMATGVLMVCLGSATRVVEYLTDHDKKYHARIRLGIDTDTYDATGKVVAERPVTATREQIETALHGFVGQQDQMPPAYSAIKQNGVPLYKLARQGKKVETPKRTIEIFSLELRDVNLPDIEIDIHCGKGTYVRSIAHDLGEALGCGAHLTALTRTASGPFTLNDSHTLEELSAAFNDHYAEKYLLPIDEALLDFQAVVVDAATAKAIQQGKALACGRKYTTSLLRAYSGSGDLIAVLERGRAPDEWKPKKVFLT